MSGGVSGYLDVNNVTGDSLVLDRQPILSIMRSSGPVIAGWRNVP